MAIASAVAGADPHPRSAGPDADQTTTPAAAGSAPLAALSSLIMRVAAVVLLAWSFARSAWRARGDPRDLAFVAGSGAVLAALLWCLRLAERLTPGSPAALRRRLQAAVWFLSTVLSCAFAYRVSLVMPAALVIIVWCMTAFVVLAGFFMLVLCNCEGQQYRRCLDEVDAGDAKPFYKINTDGLV
ncbi:unnamed protein product [Urochloa humidicola]